jgi:hypothetical protein
MQHKFLFYIEFWQLIAVVGAFVVYDNLNYLKKWTHCNYFFRNEAKAELTLALRNDSDFLYLGQSFLAESFDRENLRHSIFLA